MQQMLLENTREDNLLVPTCFTHFMCFCFAMSTAWELYGHYLGTWTLSGPVWALFRTYMDTV